MYREILRTAKHFHWVDDRSGEPWNALLRRQARREFDEARQEQDPLIVARLIVTGRDCLHQVQERFNAATQAAWERIDKDSHKRT